MSVWKPGQGVEGVRLGWELSASASYAFSWFCSSAVSSVPPGPHPAHPMSGMFSAPASLSCPLSSVLCRCRVVPHPLHSPLCHLFVSLVLCLLPVPSSCHGALGYWEESGVMPSGLLFPVEKWAGYRHLQCWKTGSFPRCGSFLGPSNPGLSFSATEWRSLPPAAQ